ncbi:hypothetical protein OBBRIDRAFT_660786 [Obba rivulosa]|uniref:Uncharacterized protein n=1 Tax=Obba rivulosa TaxID=1052685 RepID=A0A8E2DK10_9APHY|nr:hypothetical protein OBBRIDRAFT_660786 [Obba rivulosa]
MSIPRYWCQWTVFDEMCLYGFPDPIREDVKSNSYLETRVVLGIFRTRVPEHHARMELMDIYHIIDLFQKNDLLRENLANAVEAKSFSRLRCWAFWCEEGPPLDR